MQLVHVCVFKCVINKYFTFYCINVSSVAPKIEIYLVIIFQVEKMFYFLKLLLTIGDV